MLDAMLERVALVTGVPLTARRGCAVGGSAMSGTRFAMLCALAPRSPRRPWLAIPRSRFRRLMRAGDRSKSVLAALNARGYRIVYSSALVRPDDDLARGADGHAHR